MDKIRTSKKSTKKKPKRTNLLLTCLYCGADLDVIVRGIPPTPSRGRVEKTENNTMRLTVKCSACRWKSRFENSAPFITRYGWRRVGTRGVEPPALRPRSQDISETSIMLYKRRRR